MTLGYRSQSFGVSIGHPPRIVNGTKDPVECSLPAYCRVGLSFHLPSRRNALRSAHANKSPAISWRTELIIRQCLVGVLVVWFSSSASHQHNKSATPSGSNEAESGRSQGMPTLGTPRREAQGLAIEPVRKLNWQQAVRFGARSSSGAAATANAAG
jgi:hypothetical protein